MVVLVSEEGTGQIKVLCTAIHPGVLLSACVMKVTKLCLLCFIKCYAAASSMNEGDKTWPFA